MNYFFPLGNDTEREPLMENLPDTYNYAALIFFPFVRMPNGWRGKESALPHIYYPMERDIIRNGRLLTWKEVGNLCGFTSVAETSKAIKACLTSSMGREPYRRPDLQERLEEVLDETMFFPLEDRFPKHLFQELMTILQSSGANTFKYATVYEEEGQFTMEQLDEDTVDKLCSTPVMIADEEMNIVLSCFFDDVSVLLYSKEDRTSVLSDTSLEGVALEEDTPLVWENYSNPLRYFP
ncbi:DUF2711 family protein [Halobacillus salinus]|uniref:DUF2711 family protein n=1 Tax=Halobacillus salinus TaxID=192814 RepID=A0A4Z0H3H3_9BACI|nr:DUF2711 family protein [Halobacillus salinus]TGB04958.1 DUF2711 family protein [Halobacillus salinus]